MTDPDAGPKAPSVVVSVTEIRRRLGSRLAVASGLEAHGLVLGDVGVAVPEGAEITFAGEAESIHNGVVLTGVVSVPWTGHCRRCLDDIGGVAELDVREVFETHPTDGETWPLLQDHIDIGPLLHDTGLLALPLAPLCRDDCLGPAPEAFPAVGGVPDDDADLEPEVDDGPPKDPRWAALDGLDLP